jgi:hypothetical protein
MLPAVLIFCKKIPPYQFDMAVELSFKLSKKEGGFNGQGLISKISA